MSHSVQASLVCAITITLRVLYNKHDWSQCVWYNILYSTKSNINDIQAIGAGKNHPTPCLRIKSSKENAGVTMNRIGSLLVQRLPSIIIPPIVTPVIIRLLARRLGSFLGTLIAAKVDQWIRIGLLHTRAWTRFPRFGRLIVFPRVVLPIRCPILRPLPENWRHCYSICYGIPSTKKTKYDTARYFTFHHCWRSLESFPLGLLLHSVIGCGNCYSCCHWKVKRKTRFMS